MLNLPEISHLLYQKVALWFNSAVRFLPEIGIALLVILLARFLSNVVSRLIASGLGRVSDNASLVGLLGTVVRILILAVGLFIALGILGLDKTVTSLLAGAGVIALAVGFAFQDLTANFISGSMIAIARPLQTGDTVETNGFTGRVVEVKLRSIVLDNGQGQTIEIPSKDVFQKPITNLSRSGHRRLEIPFGVSYLDDLERVQQVALEAIRALPFVEANYPVQVYFRSFTLDNIQGYVWFWIDGRATSQPEAQSEAIKAIKTAFEREQILLMFRPDTLDLKKRLSEAGG
ncbi:mechanosensitive ion channel [Rudanella paleaurantiibacter]|uniref:Mechanosensitive ion channel n=1 Tax=Rudanella paleaurantiibacter TaxID=2614655 RepID=A0A7J5U114_9BACT|nr:mechanosensitive ion channel domain-containing protein [Rudanella paleaurantiibacter]KAB7731452.1 mechanosensitive ion channel [Rudanella paleaurantiibacter]